MTSPFRIEVALRTDIGKVRAQNQDAFILDDRVYGNIAHAAATATFISRDSPVFVTAIADGVGGHAAGEVASALALEEIGRCNPRTLLAAHAAIEQANRRLYLAMHAEPKLCGMGTTIAGFIAGPTSIEVFGVGDCFIAHVSGEFVRPLLRSQSEVMATTVLDAALGGTPEPMALSIETHVLDDARGRFFLATDGVLRFCEWSELRAILTQTGRNPQQLTDEIMERVLCGSAKDNATCAVIEVSDVE